MRFRSILLGSFVALCPVVAVAESQNRTPSNDALALVGATVYVGPNEEPLHDGVVLVESGRISAVGDSSAVRVPPHVESLDCTGLTITAGFWNSHVHLFERKWANAAALPAGELGRQLRDTFTRFGFTNVFDTGSMWENTRQIRDRIDAGDVPGPHILSTGEALVAPGAMPGERILAVLGLMAFDAPEVADAQDAAAAAKALLERGADAVKVHLQPPPPPHAAFPEDGIASAVAEAHRAHKPVFVHPHTGADILAAVRAGVDIVAHTTPSTGAWDETMLSEMKDHGVAVTPTLALWKSVMRHDRVSVQEALTQTAVGQLRAWVDIGGTILFGTDLGAVDPDPTEEYLLMSEAGMSFRRILTSLTTAPAERFGDPGQSGRVATGEQADLVVLSGDPSEDVRALSSVRYTIRAGKIVYRAHE